ncbi:DEAD/DEAH box helicase [Methanosphaerula subterraneus]|uniref:DEAD/DEAH box helicase n=1 Tax=Methanosphaerula subterraneus TaxID=3350244 RepID=UPI003F82F78C
MPRSCFAALHPTLRQTLQHRLGWDALRPLQEQTWQAAAGGDDLLVLAPTAGGKTEAALIPVIDRILREGSAGIACLYISPLKALINDQEERISTLARPAGITVQMWHGDVPKGERRWDDPPQILMITPESLEVLLLDPVLSADLAQLRVVVIDEVHAFVPGLRGVHLKVLLDRLDQVAMAKVQRIGLSATVGNPEAILEWLSGIGRQGQVVRSTGLPAEKRFSFIVEEDRAELHRHLSGVVVGRRALVFVKSRSEAEKVRRAIGEEIPHVYVHHSALAPDLRRAAEEATTRPGPVCIICTSTLELGIDIGGLDLVVQVGPPASVSSFLQRLGRSGRRGTPAMMTFLLLGPDDLLITLAVIEAAAAHQVEPLTPPEKPYTVVLQQMLLYLIKNRQTSRSSLSRHILPLFSFLSTEPETVDRLIDHLIDLRIVAADGGLLMLGDAGEAAFCGAGRKDLFSVLSSGSEYQVITPDGDRIGRLDGQALHLLPGDAFPLGGRLWSVAGCDPQHRLLIVTRASAGQQATPIFWIGSRSALTPLVTHGMLEIIAAGETKVPIDEDGQALLAKICSTYPSGVHRSGLQVWEEPLATGLQVVVLSFQGSLFNQVLATLLLDRLGCRVRSTDIRLVVEQKARPGAGKLVAEALKNLQSVTVDQVAHLLPLPPRETWKFASLMPDDLYREMVVEDFYHLQTFLCALQQEDVLDLQARSS